MKNNTRLIYFSFIIVAGVTFVNLLAYIAVPSEKDDVANHYNITMQKGDALSVLEIVNAEGFDGAFRHYSSYRDIQDQRFHELRKAYIAAANELIDYLGAAADTELPSNIKGDYL